MPSIPFPSARAAAFLAVLGLAHAGDMPAEPAGETLPELISLALRDNPSLRAAELEVKARHSGSEHVWHLDPPQVGVEFYQGPAKDFPNPIKNQQEIDYYLRQSFPAPGSNGARIRAQHGHAEAAESELESLRRKVVRDVKTVYYGLWLADRRLALNVRTRSLMENLIAIARRQYEVGLGGQSDILRAQAEATRLRIDSVDLAQGRLAAAADLNALLARDPLAPVRAGDSLEPRGSDASFERVAEAVGESHPDIKAKASEIRMREAEADLSRRAYWPGFMVGGAYKDMRAMPEGSHGGTLQDYWSLELSMDVPLAFWSLPKARAGSAEARAKVEQAKAELDAARNEAVARARGAALRAAGARERLRLARAVLLPQAQQAYASALAGYQGGKEGFAAVLDAYRGELAARQDAVSDAAAALTAEAELDEAIGEGAEK